MILKRIQIQYLSINMIRIRIIKIFQLKDNENKKDDYVLFDSIDYAIKI